MQKQLEERGYLALQGEEGRRVRERVAGVETVDDAVVLKRRRRVVRRTVNRFQGVFWMKRMYSSLLMYIYKET